MSGSPQALAALRHLLAERFPSAPPPAVASLPTGVAAIDGGPETGLPLSALTEVVADAPSTGGQLLLSQLLRVTRARRERMAWVDSRDAFDPQSHEPALLECLLWVRGRTLDEAMTAADILVRDANFSLLAVDLRACTPKEMRRVAPTTWYRLQRAIERTDMAVVVLTNAPWIGCARLRLQLGSFFALEDLQRPRAEIVSALPVEITRQRWQAERRTA